MGHHADQKEFIQMTPSNRAVQRIREIDWPKVVQFHRDIAWRAEENYFSITASNTGSDRFAYLRDFAPTDMAGPWRTTPQSIGNHLIQKMQQNDLPQDIFLGVPCWYVQNEEGRGWVTKCRPMLYRSIRLTMDGDVVLIEPDQGYWEVSPLVFDEFERDGYVIEDAVDQQLRTVIEVAQSTSSQQGGDLTVELVRALKAWCPPIDRLLGGQQERPSQWVIFSAPQAAGPINRNLLKDYDQILRRLSEDPHDIGGLRLLEGVLQGEHVAPDVMPVVQLNDSQMRGVGRVLSGAPITVIGGPPGCGKSQVVISTMLNAWALGKPLLFASNNNQAVEVVRERLKKFEDDCPIAVRVGSQRFNNLADAMRRTINYITAVEPDAPDRDRERRSVLESQIADKLDYLGSSIPQRVSEAVNSALQAYSKYESTRAEHQKTLKSLTDQFKGTGQLGVMEDFVVRVATPLKSWMEDAERTRQVILKNHTEREEHIKSIRLHESARDHQLLKLGVDTGQQRDWSWLAGTTAPARLQKWLDDLTIVMQMPLEQALSDLDWRSDYDRWASASIAKQWTEDAALLKETIESAWVTHRHSIEQIKLLDDEYRQKREALIQSGLVEADYPKSVLVNWTANYGDRIAQAAGKLDWLPWSPRAQALRKMRACERQLRGRMPVSVWQEISPLTDQSRAVFARYVECALRYTEAKIAWLAVQGLRDTIQKVCLDLSDRSRHLQLSDSPSLPILSDWRDYVDRLGSHTHLGESATKAWRKKEDREEAIKRLATIVSQFIAIEPGNPIKEAWLNGAGQGLFAQLRTLIETPSKTAFMQARQIIYDSSIKDLIKDWRSASDAEIRNQSAIVERDRLPSEAESTLVWWRSKPAAVLISPAILAELPTADSPLKVWADTCMQFASNYAQYAAELRPDYESKESEENTWAIKQIHSLDSILKESIRSRPVITADAGALLVCISDVVNESGDLWQTDELMRMAEPFNPGMIKASIDGLRAQQQALAFNAARRSWLNRMKQDDSLVDAMHQLLQHYQNHRNTLQPDAYENFKHVLSAMPIWITTAMSPQSIPVIPEAFDMVVIDEATQCTLTNLLPLIYRAKCLAVIGDSEQLPAIPNITPEAERYLAQRCGVEDQLPYIGHCNLDVFKIASQCLPRTISDVIHLDEHYRSNPLIIGFANKHIYQRRLKLKRPLDVVRDVATYGVVPVNVAGNCQRGGGNRSWFNTPEAKRVVSLTKQILSEPSLRHKSLGIVTPFKAQEQEIQRLLRQEQIGGQVVVGTVYKYQGDEKDIMIFSIVAAPGIPDGSVSWISKPHNQMNVAVTRARNLLYIVADYDFCGRQDGLLGELIKYALDVDKMRKTSKEELALYGMLIMEGLSPVVHPVMGDVEVDLMLEKGGRKLAIEVDGMQHTETKAEDDARDAYLRSCGCDVYRTSARSIRETPANVLAEILSRIAD